jgi:hypothetical protein
MTDLIRRIPLSAFAVHPVDIRFADAPDNDGVRSVTSANQYTDTDVKYGVDTSQMPWRQEIVPLMLLSIPIDSLHCIASFLPVRVRIVYAEKFLDESPCMVQCATEVVTTWVSLLASFSYTARTRPILQVGSEVE